MRQLHERRPMCDEALNSQSQLENHHPLPLSLYARSPW